MQLDDLGTRGNPQLRIQIRERFVHQEDIRLAHNRSAKGHPLALSPGELFGLAFEQLLQAQDFSGLLHARVDLLCGDMVQLEPESHIVKDVHVWIERVVLEDHRNVAVFGVHPIDQAVADVDATRAGFF